MGIVSKETNNNKPSVDGYANFEMHLEGGKTEKYKGYNPLSISNDLHAAMIEAEKANPGQVFTFSCTVHAIDHDAKPKAFAFAKPVVAKTAPKSRAKAA